MRIPEFAEKIAIRFDSKLSSPRQFDAFEDDCKIHLKRFEGEILSYAFHEIVYQRKFASHPKIAEIVKVCNEKMNINYKASNPGNKEQAKWRANMEKQREFKETDAFKWAALRMIGQDVLIYVGKHGKNPDKAEINKMLKAHEIFKADMLEYENSTDLSAMRAALYETGKALNEKNLMYYNQFN